MDTKALLPSDCLIVEASSEITLRHGDKCSLTEMKGTTIGITMTLTGNLHPDPDDPGHLRGVSNKGNIPSCEKHFIETIR